jgi:hypothetical protein
MQAEVRRRINLNNVPGCLRVACPFVFVFLKGWAILRSQIKLLFGNELCSIGVK